MNRDDTRMPGSSAWNHPETPRYYESFCERHERYRWANALLLEGARLAPGLSVLDLGAGTGRTAEAALRSARDAITVLCVEPADGMRISGEARLAGRPVRWTSRWPASQNRFDRILAGASVWQMTPLDETLRRLARMLEPGGVLSFNIPSLYLGIPDRPGGGSDPLLLRLPALLAAGRDLPMPAETPGAALPGAEEIDALLTECGLTAERRHTEYRFTQATYRDWLKIPPITEYLLAGMDPAGRAGLIDRSFLEVDPDSWKAEGWFFWRACSGTS